MQNHGLSVRLAVLSLFLLASLRLSVILSDWWKGHGLSIQINGKLALYSVYLHQIPDSVRGDGSRYFLDVFILRTHYISWANILYFVWLCVSSTSTRRIMRPEELPVVVSNSTRLWKESSSRRIMTLPASCARLSLYLRRQNL